MDGPRESELAVKVVLGDILHSVINRSNDHEVSDTSYLGEVAEKYLYPEENAQANLNNSPHVKLKSVHFSSPVMICQEYCLTQSTMSTFSTQDITEISLPEDMNGVVNDDDDKNVNSNDKFENGDLLSTDEVLTNCPLSFMTTNSEDTKLSESGCVFNSNQPEQNLDNIDINDKINGCQEVTKSNNNIMIQAIQVRSQCNSFQGQVENDMENEPHEKVDDFGSMLDLKVENSEELNLLYSNCGIKQESKSSDECFKHISTLENNAQDKDCSENNCFNDRNVSDCDVGDVNNMSEQVTSENEFEKCRNVPDIVHHMTDLGYDISLNAEENLQLIDDNLPEQAIDFTPTPSCSNIKLQQILPPLDLIPSDGPSSPISLSNLDGDIMNAYQNVNEQYLDIGCEMQVVPAESTDSQLQKTKVLSASSQESIVEFITASQLYNSQSSQSSSQIEVQEGCNATRKRKLDEISVSQLSQLDKVPRFSNIDEKECCQSEHCYSSVNIDVAAENEDLTKVIKIQENEIMSEPEKSANELNNESELSGNEENSQKLYCCDIDVCNVDGSQICLSLDHFQQSQKEGETVSRNTRIEDETCSCCTKDYQNRTSYFQWDQTNTFAQINESILNSQTPECYTDQGPPRVNHLPSCTKLRRVGLSKKQKVKTLHPNFKQS